MGQRHRESTQWQPTGVLHPLQHVTDAEIHRSALEILTACSHFPLQIRKLDAEPADAELEAGELGERVERSEHPDLAAFGQQRPLDEPPGFQREAPAAHRDGEQFREPQRPTRAMQPDITAVPRRPGTRTATAAHG